MESAATELQKMHTIRSGEIVIEIDNHCLEVTYETVTDDVDILNPLKAKKKRKEVLSGNRHEHFSPVEYRPKPKGEGCNFIRSRFMPNRQDTFMYQESNSSLQGIEYIPGERIHINVETRVGRITDGIYDSENSELYMRLIDASRNRPNRFYLVPGEYYEAELKTEAALWDWIFWMRKICDGDPAHSDGPDRHKGCSLTGSRRCRPVQNIEKLPTMMDILKKGVVRSKLGPMTKDMADEFDNDHKLHGGDYFHPIDRRRGEVVLTPYLMGMEVANAD